MDIVESCSNTSECVQSNNIGIVDTLGLTNFVG